MEDYERQLAAILFEVKEKDRARLSLRGGVVVDARVGFSEFSDEENERRTMVRGTDVADLENSVGFFSALLGSSTASQVVATVLRGVANGGGAFDVASDAVPRLFSRALMALKLRGLLGKQWINDAVEQRGPAFASDVIENIDVLSKSTVAREYVLAAADAFFENNSLGDFLTDFEPSLVSLRCFHCCSAVPGVSYRDIIAMARVVPEHPRYTVDPQVALDYRFYVFRYTRVLGVGYAEALRSTQRFTHAAQFDVKLAVVDAIRAKKQKLTAVEAHGKYALGFEKLTCASCLRDDVCEVESCVVRRSDCKADLTTLWACCVEYGHVCKTHAVFLSQKSWPLTTIRRLRLASGATVYCVKLEGAVFEFTAADGATHVVDGTVCPVRCATLALNAAPADVKLFVRTEPGGDTVSHLRIGKAVFPVVASQILVVRETRMQKMAGKKFQVTTAEGTVLECDASGNTMVVAGAPIGFDGAASSTVYIKTVIDAVSPRVETSDADYVRNVVLRENAGSHVVRGRFLSVGNGLREKVVPLTI